MALGPEDLTNLLLRTCCACCRKRVLIRDLPSRSTGATMKKMQWANVASVTKIYFLTALDSVVPDQGASRFHFC